MADEDVNIRSGRLVAALRAENFADVHRLLDDAAHQAISVTGQSVERRFETIDEECVGCNLCAQVCPVEDCITIMPADNGKP